MAGSNPVIRIRNIHDELTEQDLTDLLAQVGPVKFVTFTLDNSSVAYGCFQENHLQLNHEAITRFNGKKAMGKILIVEDPRDLKDRIGGPRGHRGPKGPRGVNGPRGFNRSQRGGPRGGPRGRGPKGYSPYGNAPARRPKKPKKTAEDLDEELSAYMQQN